MKQAQISSIDGTTLPNEKVMLSTPDLKRLRSIEDFAIDIVSYAHNSYSPTILNYYKKGKDFSFLKVSRALYYRVLLLG
jgi:hypothetical protein